MRFLLGAGFFSTSVKGGLNSLSTLVVLDLITQRHTEALVSGQTMSGGGVAPQNSSA